MNSRRYNFLRALHFFSGLLPSVLAIFLPRDRQTIIFNSQFNNTFEHNSKALFIYALNNDEKIKVKYVVNNKEKRVLLTKKYGNHFITNYKIRDILKILSSYTWVCSSLETPISGIGLNIRRRVFHLGHGAPLKSIGLGETKLNPIKVVYYHLIRTNFSFFMSSSHVFDLAWQNCLGVGQDRVKRCPQARCDQISSPDSISCDKLLRKDAYNVLYAPTWRPYTDTKLFPFDDFDLETLNSFLENKNINIFLRLHPNFEALISDDLLRCKRVSILSSEDISDINSILGGFDLLVTDYSSIYIDFLLTEKPVLFLPYDYENYMKTVGFSIDYEQFTPGPKPSSMESFTHEIDKLLSMSEYYLAERRRVNSVLNPTVSEHAKRSLERLKALVKY